MKAVILVAGEGRRLRPHTRSRPKCLVELAGVSLLQRQLATLEACGVRDLTLVTGHCAEALADLGYPTRHNPDYGHTNMVRSLMCAADLLDGSDDVLISYGDIVYEPRVLRALLACPDALSICVDRNWRQLWETRMENPLADAETLRLDARERVLEIGRKPQSFAEIDAQYMGLVKLKADFAPKLVRYYRGLDNGHRHGTTDLARLDMTRFLQQLVEGGYPLRAVPVHGGWLEVDTTADLTTYEEMARAGTLEAFFRDSTARAESCDVRPSRANARGKRDCSPLPRVWILADYMVGHTNQCIGLAEALGWPYQVKTLEFNGLNGLNNQLLGATRLTLSKESAAKLAPPWPELLICAGRRLTPPARFVAKRSGGHTRLVQLGRKGGNRVEPFDLVVACAHFGQPSHPRRLQVLAPITMVTDARLAKAAADWRALCPDPARAPIGLLVGGSCGSHRLDADTTRAMGQAVGDFARAAGRSLMVVTSRRTPPEAMEVLEQILGDTSALFYRWRRGDPANPYWGCLALASALVVTGESESMLAEAVAVGRPVYIYPIPDRRRTRYRITSWIAARGSAAKRRNLWSRLVECGLVHVPRDISTLHSGLFQAGAARPFGEPFDETPVPPLREMARVVHRVRALMCEQRSE